MSDTIALVTHLRADQEDQYRSALAAAMPGEEIATFRQMSAQQREQARIAIVANPDPTDLAALPNLAWLHSLWAGVEQLVQRRSPDGPPVVRLIDPEMSRTMAEAVLAWTFYLQRDMPAYRQQQHARIWSQRDYRKPSTLTVGMLGLGALGSAAARRLAEAGFRVVGWSRSPKTLPGLETLSDNDGLEALLSRSDIVVCLIPLTQGTRGLLSARRFRAMKPGAALINFARGPVIVADDLLAALDSGQLSHAVLDVFDEEPLTPDSRFWHHPAVTVLPHISAPTDFETSAAVVAANVARYRETGSLPRTVEAALGY